MLKRLMCPKCRSSLVEKTRDEHGEYEHCLMCGYVAEQIDPRTMIEVALSIPTESNPNARLRAPRMTNRGRKRLILDA